MYQNMKHYLMNKKPLAILLVICLCLFPLLSLADAVGYAAVTGGTLKLRQTASQQAMVLGKYPTGTWVEILEYGDTWDKVTVGGKTGYMMDQYLTEGTANHVAQRYVRTNTGVGVNLRSAPYNSASAITGVAEGTLVDVLVKGITWYKVRVGEQVGYIASKYLSTGSGNSAAQYAVVYNKRNSQVLFLRKSASTSAAILGQYKNYTPVTVLQAGNTWCKVEVDGKTGYMMTAYLKFTSAPGSATVANPNGGTFANFRSSASWNASIIKTVSVGISVTVLDKGTDWTLVSVDGKTGYISTWFLIF